ncbi:Uncharacterized protein TCM_029368 [Theobroma cacao]|uniref:GDSL esterase/lipase n=1 Tax=Theobroma cacao TaxID=3641 RepID=A0A061GDN2_THECC|nr:Uncharacterized protein TCM_029368 [Theobroma cacao]
MGTMLNRLIIISAMYQILAIHFSSSICSAKKVSAMFVFGDSLVELFDVIKLKVALWARAKWPETCSTAFGYLPLPHVCQKSSTCEMGCSLAGTLEFNVDGFVRGSPGDADIGDLLRDNTGRVRVLFS